MHATPDAIEQRPRLLRGLRPAQWWAMLCLLGSVLGLAGCSHGDPTSPGSAAYVFHDHDARLTEFAKHAQPIIAVLTAYQKRAKSFPLDANELNGMLPRGQQVIGVLSTLYESKTYSEWIYYVDGEGGCILELMLSQETALAYHSDGKKSGWRFCRLDFMGNNDTEVLLEPEG